MARYSIRSYFNCAVGRRRRAGEWEKDNLSLSHEKASTALRMGRGRIFEWYSCECSCFFVGTMRVACIAWRVVQFTFMGRYLLQTEQEATVYKGMQRKRRNTFCTNKCTNKGASVGREVGSHLPRRTAQ
jgi:hypothetical protein